MHKLSIAFLLFYSFCVNAQFPKYEFRGVWVTTVNNLDWPSSEKLSPEQQKQEFLTILDTIQAYNLNAVFVQIRAAGDAFYPSEIEPWSAWLTGKQGKAPEPYYDPLQFMIEACHERNIEFHAWFNLVRGVNHMRFFPASPKHIYSQHPEWFFEIGERRFFNLGIPDVRNYTVNVILDVVNRYKELDGVHLDDYFYPEEIRQNKISDQHTFQQYKEAFTNIHQWRVHNIDTLIYQLADSIRKVNPQVKFGISPVSVWRHKHLDSLGSDTKHSISAYDDLYADTKKWIEMKWIDYIIPQNYGNTLSNIVKHESITHWWSTLNTNRHRYIGLALYKWGNDPWKEWHRENEIPLQIALQRENPNLLGNALFRYNSLLSLKPEYIQNLKSHYSKPALPPVMEWKCQEQSLPETPRNIQHHWQHDTLTLLFDSEENTQHLLYGFEKKEPLYISDFSHLISILPNQGEYKITVPENIEKLIITTIDRCYRESKNFHGIKRK